MINEKSPSVWREWIEISIVPPTAASAVCLPPCGGSGLKYHHHGDHRDPWDRLPPCGGSGLK